MVLLFDFYAILLQQGFWDCITMHIWSAPGKSSETNIQAKLPFKSQEKNSNTTNTCVACTDPFLMSMDKGKFAGNPTGVAMMAVINVLFNQSLVVSQSCLVPPGQGFGSAANSNRPWDCTAEADGRWAHSSLEMKHGTPTKTIRSDSVICLLSVVFILDLQGR